MENAEIRTLLAVHQALLQRAADLAKVLLPHLLQVGDSVTEDSTSSDVHKVVAVHINADGYGVELGPTYCGGGFVIRGDCVTKVETAR